VTSSWTARYPDLTGKAVVVAGDSPLIEAVVRALASNNMLLAVVAPDREIIDRALAITDALGVAAFGMTADPASPPVWERIGQHIEQRLGPIDVVIAIAAEPTRRVVAAALVPDMTRRGHGVLIEVADDAATIAVGGGVRHRAIAVSSPAPDDVAALVVFCASDTVSAPTLSIT
jgi:hypothetical protein